MFSALIMDATGLAGLASALGDVLTTDAFMTALTTLVPVIGGVLVFAFTYRIVRRLVSGGQKEKQEYNFLFSLIERSFYLCLKLQNNLWFNLLI